MRKREKDKNKTAGAKNCRKFMAGRDQGSMAKGLPIAGG
jgi:hypothetical protein